MGGFLVLYPPRFARDLSRVDGPYIRLLAKTPLEPEHLWAHLPAKINWVCYPPNRQPQIAMKYLEKHIRLVEIPELPGWICYNETQRSQKYRDTEQAILLSLLSEFSASLCR